MSPSPFMSRRTFITASLLGMAGVSALGDNFATKTKITGITPEGAPPANGYTHGIAAEGGGKIIFVPTADRADRKADMETQIRQTLENVAKVVEKPPMGTMKDVVILRAYFLNIQRDLITYRKVRKEFFFQTVSRLDLNRRQRPGRSRPASRDRGRGHSVSFRHSCMKRRPARMIPA